MEVRLHTLELGDKLKINNPEHPGIYEFIGVDGQRAILKKGDDEIKVSIGLVKKVRGAEHYEFVTDIYLSEADGN